MRKYSFKLFSTNLRNNPKIVEEGGEYVRAHSDRMFIELMIVPDTPKSDLDIIKGLLRDIEVRIHAPHHLMKVDVGNKNLEKQNREILSQSQYAADLFNASTIVVHGGCGQGTEVVRESARQIKLLNDQRIVVENLPVVAEEGLKLSGNTPEEIAYIREHSGCGFCFDFSHALCAANSLKIDIDKQLAGFFALKPTVYHLCDGFTDEIEDKHLHFGEGNYPLSHFLNEYTANNAYITMETGHGMPESIRAWVDDFKLITSMEKEKQNAVFKSFD